jgi:serine/threonine protein phosphatase 1
MDIHYAIGDVHGRDDLLGRLIERITATHRDRHGDARAVIVYLGDYIDRGANSLAVIDRAMRGVPGFDTVCLLGNHEKLMLACLDTDDRYVWTPWLGNGGDETVRSLGITLRCGQYDPLELARALGDKRIAWLRTLPLYYRAGPYFFVHAGIVPGRPIEKQRERDMLWIRHQFLDSDEDHGFCVVHGHTPSPQPELRPNRIGIDTGSTFSGKLTAVALGETDGPRFETITGEPGRGA